MKLRVNLELFDSEITTEMVGHYNSTMGLRVPRFRLSDIGITKVLVVDCLHAELSMASEGAPVIWSDVTTAKLSRQRQHVTCITQIVLMW